MRGVNKARRTVVRPYRSKSAAVRIAALARLLPLAVLLLVLLGCDSGNVAPVNGGPNSTTQPAVNHAPAPSATPPQAQPAPADPGIAIYRAVVADLVARSDQHGYPLLYIGPRLGSGQALDVTDNSPATPPTLLDQLHHLPDGSSGSASVYLATFAAVTGPPEEGSVVRGGGGFVTLGQITYDAAGGSATVRGSIYQSRADAVGVIYQFARVGGAWQMQTAAEEWRGQGVG